MGRQQKKDVVKSVAALSLLIFVASLQFSNVTGAQDDTDSPEVTSGESLDQSDKPDQTDEYPLHDTERQETQELLGQATKKFDPTFESACHVNPDLCPR